MFIEKLTEENDDKVYKFLAEKFNVSIYCVKRSVSFVKSYPLLRVYKNENPDEVFKLKEGNLAITDFNFYHQENKWDGENNFDLDLMLFMYKIYGPRYLREFCVYRTMMSHGLYKTDKPKARRQKLQKYNDETGKAFSWVKEQAETVEHVV